MLTIKKCDEPNWVRDLINGPFSYSRPNSITAPSTKAAKLPPPRPWPPPQRALRGGSRRGEQRQQGVPLLVAHALGPAPRAPQDRAADRPRGRRQAKVQEGQAGAIQVRGLVRLREFVRAHNHQKTLCFIVRLYHLVPSDSAFSHP